MKVLINPTKTQSGSGLTASCSWENHDMKKALNILFGVNEQKEKIIQIEISDDGIVARLEYVPR